MHSTLPLSMNCEYIHRRISCASENSCLQVQSILDEAPGKNWELHTMSIDANNYMHLIFVRYVPGRQAAI